MATRRPLSKDEARRLAYERLRATQAARFPFPIEGRIPNFRGVEAAAEHLRELVVYRDARALKVNPDAPQLPVRAAALADGKTLFLPTPRLRGAFVRIGPGDVPPGEERAAAAISGWRRYGREVPPDQVAVDLVVCGSVAVAPDGARAGKGAGYSDLEYGMLRALGHREVPAVTTVHRSQVVPSIAMEPHDISLDWILTPEGAVETHTPYAKPTGVDWELIPDDAATTMPPLGDVAWTAKRVRDIVAPGLRVLFVGINPGHATASAGHHFAGPGNHFWRLLHESGLTPGRLQPADDTRLLDLGLGVTNLVARPSRGEQDLRAGEFAEGGAGLRARVADLAPKVVALLGKQVYRAYAGLPGSAAVAWGLQDRQTVPGVREVAAPNPSARSTVPYHERLSLFRAIADAAGAR